jgi:hypothetical protein
MNSPLAGVKPSWDCYVSSCWPSSSSPSPLSHDWFIMRTGPLFWRCMVVLLTELWARFHQYPELLLHGPVTSLIGSHPPSSTSSARGPPSSTLWERVSWLLFRLSLCLFSIRFSGHLELFSDSHLSILNFLNLSLQECSTWAHRPLILTSLQPCHHENHVTWVDSSQMLPWASFETLGLLHIKRTSLPGLITSRTFWSKWTWSRRSSLALCNMSPECLEGFPSYVIPATLNYFF